MHVGGGHELVAGEGGKLFLGATASVGNMQRLREAAKLKQTTFHDQWPASGLECFLQRTAGQRRSNRSGEACRQAQCWGHAVNNDSCCPCRNSIPIGS